MTDRPLGIADIAVLQISTVERPLNDHWYWCRRHEKAENVSEPTMHYGIANPIHCIRIGPFMSEREANRLGANYDLPEAQPRRVPPLGMEVEG